MFILTNPLAESFVQDRPFTKIWAGPSASRSLILKMKKLLDDGLDLMWWPRGGKKWCERTEHQTYATESCFCWRTCQRRCLLRDFQTAYSSLGQEGCSLAENTSFCGFSAGLCRPNHLAVIGGILVLVDWPPYSPDLNSVDFSIWSVLQPKGQAMLHANLSALRSSIAAEWDRLVVVQIRRTCRSFCWRSKPSLRKIS
jgi:hypothetical protein